VPKRYLIDTDVLIEYLRGNQEAVRFLEELGGVLYVSAITVAELSAGAHPGAEEQALEQFLRAFDVVPVEAELARAGGVLRRDYGPSHGVGLADALIAASADALQATLVTFNRRHFPMLASTLAPPIA
jgi:predicted nucleic acid-binding protein